MSTSELLTLNHVSAGMVLSHELVDANGLVLLAKGAVLSEAMIASLRRHGVEAVAVVASGDPEAAPDPAAVRARLDHLFRHNDRSEDDAATSALRRYVEHYRLGQEVQP
jgi:hypothetical protein